MTPSIDRDLQAFAKRYRLNSQCLNLGSWYIIQNAPSDFTGKVDSIKIVQFGRFGNNFYQLLHATLLARYFECPSIEMFPYDCGPDPLTIEGLTFRFSPTPQDTAAPVPALVGFFFETDHFGSVLRNVNSAYVCDRIERDLYPLFLKIRNTKFNFSPNTLVIHFRSGDIFGEGSINPWYVQPPASFYAKAITHARETLDIQDVALVFEDRGNPAIAMTETFLQSQSIPFSVQSGQFAADLACLRGAHHLVASFGTLCEAAALLSDNLRTYFAFRTMDSHEHLHLRSRPLFPAMLVRRNVTPVLIDDPERGYIPRLKWNASPAQLEKLRNYPIDKLTIEPGAWGAVWTGPHVRMLRTSKSK